MTMPDDHHRVLSFAKARARVRPHVRSGHSVRGYEQHRQSGDPFRRIRLRDGVGVATPRRGYGGVVDRSSPLTVRIAGALIERGELPPTPEELKSMKWWRHDYPHQCYAMAGRFMLRTDIPDARLVFGTYGSREEPSRYGHAWVELPGGRVFDGNLQRIFSKAVYERLFQTLPYMTYSKSRALAAMIRHQNFGPWAHRGALRNDPHYFEEGERPPKQ